MFLIVSILLLAGAVVFQVLAWKRSETVHWVLTFVLEFLGQVINLFLMFYYNSEASLIREHVSGALDASIPFGKFAIVALGLSFVFFTMLIISVVLAFGHRALVRNGEL